ncbi:ER-to-golgi transport membrane protein [Dioszegia hungarica]|uniref:ER-to-golgi transport membrane protein n=1 Tax=Dioszegia hungarica TaxID=4972 RepID=A0AA38HDN7_9TREE|nr:ER-to-golgi transport membrane protein [Dioszegia hungarica]KAI9638225.1 ER-to-golgi transport membrane protein [Dioszegia hungarica]
MVFGYFRQVLYISLLFTNAIAILNEERFLAKIGWSTRSAQAANAGFGHAPNAYDAFGGEVSIKSKLVNLISATRTLMRIPLIVFNVVIIVYELLLG